METNIIQVKETETNTSTILSLEVAEMIEKPHNELMKNIRRFTSHFNEGKISHVDFWTESTYLDSKGETRPCYLVTKKGCEFIAHKTTGVKGTLFTARYINRFHEMEKKIHNPVLTDNRLEIAKLLIQAPKSRIASIRALYPEYFLTLPEVNSLEYISDINTSYRKWIEDLNITKDWIGDFPTVDIFNNYARYCIDNRLEGMGKKTFYRTLENDFGLTRKQRNDGQRYFISA